MADRVSVPRWIRIRGKGTTVGPNRAPFMFALEELQHPAGSIHELNWRGHEHDAREPNGIALQNRVIPAGARPGSVSRYLLIELCLRPGRHGRKILLRGE